MITNITFNVYAITEPQLMLGHPPPHMPDYIKKNRGVHPLTHRRYNNTLYNDNACFMRCVALKQGAGIFKLEAHTIKVMSELSGCRSLQNFKGVKLTELDEYEQKLKTNINVYALNDVDGKVSATVIRRSAHLYTETMNLNLFENHFSYIHDIRRYTGTYICDKCDKMWKSSTSCCRHMQQCNGGTTYLKYPGGNYAPPPTLRQKLAEEGIELPENLKFHPYHIVYDIESYFPQENPTPENPTKLVYTKNHVPLSVGIYSNVPGHDTGKCLVTAGNTHDLVANMVNAMTTICDTSKNLLTAEAEEVFELIDLKIAEIELVDDKAGQHPLVKLKDELAKFINIIPVIGFSSSRYDLNVLRPFLLPHLTQGSCIIKKTNQYLSLSNDRLKFLDIQNYLAPNYSYKQYLAAYNCELTKSFFPYNYVTNLECLDEKKLPDREHFYNEMTGTTITQEDYDECLRVWQSENMQTFRDWLVFYNLRDVIPFSEAIVKHSAFFKDRGIDIFFDGISLPGLCDRFLHSTLPDGCYFSLFNQKNSDIFEALRDNVCGGPALSFKRKIQKGDPIRGHEAKYEPHKTCETILGIDANSLYLYCMSKPMPTGNYYRRRSENGFRLEDMCMKQSIGCREWLNYLQQSEGRDIHHLYRNGREKRLGGRNIPVDGFDKDDQTVFQFHGCYYHGHNCMTGKLPDDELKKRRKKTDETTQYLRNLGYIVEEMWECHWHFLRRADDSIARLAPKGPEWASRLTHEQILTLVLSGELFGFLEVDIEVPPHLRDKFSEFPPIFKNCMVGIDDIGPHMKQHCEDMGIMKRPRRSLISSFYAKKAMFTSLLLQWYLKHGLVITKIYQIVQYTPQACFQNFVDQVTEARRSADVDPNKAIIASAFKLLGNSAYGRSLMRKDKHLDTTICTISETQKAVNESRFHHMVEVNDEYYEVFTNKTRIAMNTAICIGFQVYNLAKLELLKCYYDFLDRFIDRSSFELICGDTDSLYFALSESNIDDAVKPALKDYFKRVRGTLLPAERCLTHPDLVEPLPCCTAYHRHQMRQPGLWKIEAEADGIISLSPKCYICIGGSVGSKVTAKGVQKKINNLQFQHFDNVLASKRNHMVVNRGFRLNNQQKMSSYVQPKIGLSYTYIKRKVSLDGVNTSPLDL